MTRPYELGCAEDRLLIHADTSPNEAYRFGWRDCIRHLVLNHGQVFIQDDDGAVMCQPGDRIVYDVINAWPDPFLTGYLK